MQASVQENFLESRAYASAVLLEKIVRGAYDKRRSSEVQPLQWSILRYLGTASEERSTANWIANFLGLTHAPVGRALKTLENRSYVSFDPNPADGRSRIVRLTDEGLAVLHADPLIAIAQQIERLDEPEKDSLMTAVKQLISNSDTEK